MCLLDIQVMEAENAERRRLALTPAHGPEEWKALKERWEPVLGESAVLGLFK